MIIIWLIQPVLPFSFCKRWTSLWFGYCPGLLYIPRPTHHLHHAIGRFWYQRLRYDAGCGVKLRACVLICDLQRMSGNIFFCRYRPKHLVADYLKALRGYYEESSTLRNTGTFPGLVLPCLLWTGSSASCFWWWHASTRVAKTVDRTWKTELSDYSTTTGNVRYRDLRGAIKHWRLASR